jgi:streptogrisin C
VVGVAALYPQKKSGSGSWTTVATSKGTTSTENITYNGTAGTYRWKVNARTGKGAYSLATVRP